MRAASLLVAGLAFAVPLAVLGVVGMNFEGQAAILARVDETGARIITVTSAGDSGAVLPAAAVERIGNLQGVAWVIGLGPVADVRNGLGVGPAPLLTIRAVRAPITLTPEASRGLDGAYVSTTSATRLGLSGAYGALAPGSIPVLGWFRARDPLGALDAFALLPRHDDTQLLERIIVAVDDVGWVDLTTAHIRDLVGSDATAVSTVTGSEALIAAREAIRNEVGRRDRLLVLVLMGAAMLAAAAVVSVGTLSTRRDFGRRRALGATRGQLTMLVMLTTFWPSVAGAAAGVLGGWAYLTSQLGHAADPEFPAAIGVLVVLALVVASIVPAAHAATRDPLRVLRMP